MRRRVRAKRLPAHTRLRQIEAQHLQAEERLRLLTAAVERGFAGTLNSLEFMRTRVERLIEDSSQKADLEHVRNLLARYRDQLDRARLEVRVLSDLPEVQLSSLQQLSAVGDGVSHEFLIRAADAGLDGVENARLLATLADIEQRTRRRTGS